VLNDSIFLPLPKSAYLDRTRKHENDNYLQELVGLVFHALHHLEQLREVLFDVASVLGGGDGQRGPVHRLVFPLVLLVVDVGEVVLSLFEEISRSGALRVGEQALARAVVLGALWAEKVVISGLHKM